MTITLGVSLKMYFGHKQADIWARRVAQLARNSDAMATGLVSVFVVPGYLQIPGALTAFADSGVGVGAQDVAAHDYGPYTGEVSPAELAEIGVGYAEVGHAERRRLFAETDQVVAAKAAAAVRNGLTPVLCVGEEKEQTAPDAAASALKQLRAGLADVGAARVIVAYEPVWAIGRQEPAPIDHIMHVAGILREVLRTEHPGSRLIYGGSARPGLLSTLGDSVDGLFLGRFAHNVDNLAAIIEEARQLASVTGSRG